MNDAGPTIRVNGEARPFEAGAVTDLLRGIGLPIDRPGIAVAVNGVVVPRRLWTNQELRAGDEIEIVGAVAGG